MKLIKPHLVSDSLKLNNNVTVALDYSWRDVKQRCMTDMMEVKADFFKLMKTHLIPLAKKGDIKFVLL